jgi:translation initiation factor 1
LASAGLPEGPQPSASTEPVAVRERARGRLVLRRETKQRGGKAVIVVAGFAQLSETDEALGELTKELKQLLGCGGTLSREREIILQGDNPTQIAEHLRAKGYRVVGVGS